MDQYGSQTVKTIRKKIFFYVYIIILLVELSSFARIQF